MFLLNKNKNSLFNHIVSATPLALMYTIEDDLLNRNIVQVCD